MPKKPKVIEVPVFELECCEEDMRKVIEKRLDLFEEKYGAKRGTFIQITDSAYHSISEITHSSPGLALHIVDYIISSDDKFGETFPYVITEKHVKKLNLTYEEISKASVDQIMFNRYRREKSDVLE